jgi:maltose alpha-D-glucosyltransferase/alpha-amylase
VVRPAIGHRQYGNEKINVADQRRDPESLLNWTERMIRTRKECPEISWGEFTVLRTNAAEVLALRYDWRNTSLVTLHNFSGRRQNLKLKVGCQNDDVLVDVFDGHHSRAHNDGAHRIRLNEFAWRWYRVGAADTTLRLSNLNPEKLADR